MSRSAFAVRFSELVGESPMHYVARWRMQEAASRLQEPVAHGLRETAEAVGYGSEASFHRALKRLVAVTPGRMKRRASA